MGFLLWYGGCENFWLDIGQLYRNDWKQLLDFCTVTFYLLWRHISVVKAAKLDLAALTDWSQVSNSDDLMIGRASKLSLQSCSRATLLSNTNLSRCHLICHCTFSKGKSPAV